MIISIQQQSRSILQRKNHDLHLNISFLKRWLVGTLDYQISFEEFLNKFAENEMVFVINVKIYPKSSNVLSYL